MSARPRPQSWGSAFLVMLGVAALLWGVQIVNAGDGYEFDRYGLEPRTTDGLWGVVTMPFLHASYHHLLANTLPLLAIGWVVLLSGVREWASVTATVVLVGGALTWLVGPSHTMIVGASGMIFGWLGYLLARAYFTRKLTWVVAAAFILVFFGSLLGGLLPTVSESVAWQAHLCGFAVGVASGAVLHPPRGVARGRRRSVVS